MLRSKFVKFVACQPWNDKSVPLKILCASSVSWKITHLTFLAQTIYALLKRSPLTWKFLRLSSSRVKICQIPYICQFWNDKSIPLQMVYPCSVSWKRNPLYLFSSNNIYFAQKEPIKVKIFEIFKYLGQNSSNSWHVNLEMTSQFLLKFYILLQFHER